MRAATKKVATRLFYLLTHIQLHAEAGRDEKAESDCSLKYESRKTSQRFFVLLTKYNVSAIAAYEGNCQIVVTAVAGYGYNASVERITVVVDRTPSFPLTVGEPSWHADITEDGATYYFIYHRVLSTYADLNGWNNGASITFHYEGYDWAGTARNFFRVLNPNGTVIAGDFTSYNSADGDVTYTISAADLASCLDDATGEYKFTIQYTDWDFNGTPNITSASVTKIAN